MPDDIVETVKREVARQNREFSDQFFRDVDEWGAKEIGKPVAELRDRIEELTRLRLRPTRRVAAVAPVAG